jgi:hypothetical protein
MMCVRRHNLQFTASYLADDDGTAYHVLHCSVRVVFTYVAG